MSLYDGSISYAPIGDGNNPYALKDFIKPSRWVFNNVDPLPDSGENEWFYVNTVTADLFQKTAGVWYLVYNFNTGGGSGGITAIENDGEGVNIFKNLIGSTAHLRSLTSEANEIDIEEDTPINGSINLKMNVNYKPETLSLVNNFPLQGGLGQTTFNPNGLLGAPQGFNQGSIVVQLPSTLWICQNPTTLTWIQQTSSSGVNDIVNASAGATVLKDLTGGVATLRTIQGEISKIAVLQASNYLIIDILSSYRPETLSNILENKRFGFGSLSSPTFNNDSSQGYAVGSIFTEVELGGTVRLWICKDASIGAAVWQEFTSSTTSVKDYIQFNTIVGYTQSINGTLQDMNLGVSANIQTLANASNTKFTHLFDGSREVIRRSVVSSAKSYQCSFSFIAYDGSGATPNQASYQINMIRKSDSHRFLQSYNMMTIDPSDQTRRSSMYNSSFIFHEPSLGQVEYYFEIEGLINRGSPFPSTAQNFQFEVWNLSFHEV